MHERRSVLRRTPSNIKDEDFCKKISDVSCFCKNIHQRSLTVFPIHVIK